MEFSSSDLTVEHRPEEQRFVIELDGKQAVAEYRLDGSEMRLIHTEVPPQMEGQGAGGLLARTALDHARSEGLSVVPQCRFIEAWIRRHPEYGTLVRDRDR